MSVVLCERIVGSFLRTSASMNQLQMVFETTFATSGSRRFTRSCIVAVHAFRADGVALVAEQPPQLGSKVLCARVAHRGQADTHRSACRWHGRATCARLRTMKLVVVLSVLGLSCVPALLPPPPPQPPSVVTALSFNLANGAGDDYRTAAQRAAQRRFLDASGAGLVALQEVDSFVLRSGDVDVLREVTPFDCEPADWSTDGVRTCAGDGGVSLMARALCGPDPYANDAQGVPAGIPGGGSTDRRASACYGVALVVRNPLRVTSAFTLGLPNSLDGGVVDDELDALLTAPELTQATRDRLGAHNAQLRRGPAIEPRTALVAHVARPHGAPLAVIAVHFEPVRSGDLAQHQLARVRSLVRWERQRGRGVILLGDFNLTPAQASAVLADAGVVRAVEPAAVERPLIDQVWLDSALVPRRSEQRSTDGTSDHLTAPFVEFE
jgi:endonuclease/exonuclease/phosphatase family metal-dependent hydrolase